MSKGDKRRLFLQFYPLEDVKALLQRTLRTFALVYEFVKHPAGFALLASNSPKEKALAASSSDALQLVLRNTELLWSRVFLLAPDPTEFREYIDAPTLEEHLERLGDHDKDSLEQDEGPEEGSEAAPKPSGPSSALSQPGPTFTTATSPRGHSTWEQPLGNTGPPHSTPAPSVPTAAPAPPPASTLPPTTPPVTHSRKATFEDMTVQV